MDNIELIEKENKKDEKKELQPDRTIKPPDFQYVTEGFTAKKDKRFVINN